MTDKRRDRLVHPSIVHDASLTSATPESIGSMDLVDNLSAKPKRAFVSPRRIPKSVEESKSFVSANKPSVSVNVIKHGSPGKKVSRPCSHSALLDGDNNELSFDSYGATPISSTPVSSTPVSSVRRRIKAQARSASSEATPIVQLPPAASQPVTDSNRVRSWSPDGRTCCSPAWDEKTSKLKRQSILTALDALPSPDVATIRQLAISKGGLLDNSLRKRAWPSLLDIDINNIPPKPKMGVMQRHRDYQQVLLDVNRSSKRFPPGMLEEIRLLYQDQLIECIMWILVCHEDLHYYQGFHDVVVTFLLVVGEELTFAIMDKLVENHFRDFMYENMDKTTYMLHYLLPLIGKASPRLRNFMERSEVGSLFCLSWLITWYGHVLGDFKDIVRLYDFFIACHPLMPIYLAADIVLFREEAVLACECEMPFVHGLLSRIPDDLPFELLISRTGDLFIQYPPAVLEPEAASQYKQFVDENERRRVAAVAQREKLKAAKNRPRPFPVVFKPKSGLFIKYGVVTVFIAMTAIAYMYRSNGVMLLMKWLGMQS